MRQPNKASRKYPGEPCVRSVDDPDTREKGIEVRDKPVAVSDVQIFENKCVAMGVREAALVMVSDRQPALGVGLTLFHGWTDFVEEALFWAILSKPVAARAAVALIHDRLVTVEASSEAVTFLSRQVET